MSNETVYWFFGVGTLLDIRIAGHFDTNGNPFPDLVEEGMPERNLLDMLGDNAAAAVRTSGVPENLRDLYTRDTFLAELRENDRFCEFIAYAGRTAGMLLGGEMFGPGDRGYADAEMVQNMHLPVDAWTARNLEDIAIAVAPTITDVFLPALDALLERLRERDATSEKPANKRSLPNTFVNDEWLAEHTALVKAAVERAIANGNGDVMIVRYA